METLEQLNAYGPDEFEPWLDARLRAQYSRDPDAQYRAFDFRELGIPFGESNVDQLLSLLHKLTAGAQNTFRSAAESLFRHAEVGDFPADAMTDLVHILGLTKSYRAFEAFAPIIGNGPWGEVQRSLFYDALSVLLTFDRTQEAYDSTKALVTSRHFPVGYVFDAYLILVRSHPEHWSQDLALLRGFFASLHRHIDASGDESRKDALRRRHGLFAHSFLEAVSLSQIAAQLGELALPSDAWLLHSLIGDTGPLYLTWSPDGLSLHLVKRNAEQRYAPIPPCDGFEAFCISLHYVSSQVSREELREDWSDGVATRLRLCLSPGFANYLETRREA